MPEDRVPLWWRGLLALVLLAPPALALLLLGPREAAAVLLVLPVMLLHEAGHLLAMRQLGVGERRILFLPLHGWAQGDSTARGLASALLAGPLPGLALALGLQAAYRPSTDALAGAFVAWLVLFNGANLLPVPALDGGRLLEIALLRQRLGAASWLWLAPALSLAFLAWRLEASELVYVAGIAFLAALLHLPRLRQEPPQDADEARWVKACSEGPEPRWWMLLIAHALGLAMAAGTLLMFADDTKKERDRIVARLVESVSKKTEEEMLDEWRAASPMLRERALTEATLRYLATRRWPRVLLLRREFPPAVK